MVSHKNTHLIFLNLLVYNLIFLLLGKKAEAGVQKYTYLEAHGQWTIERRYDIKNNKIDCRASIKNNFSWFGDRIRINKDGNLLIPKDGSDTELKNKKEIETVREKLSKCKSSILYSPQPTSVH